MTSKSLAGKLNRYSKIYLWKQVNKKKFMPTLQNW